ncbi:hypothetical protein PRK78_002213 [Emydomyces testavorans]|uniref:Uncharacterized protein n=1 Tax=Emydomyces testavorans TaxID=2070801 RepID=A0AAF0DDY5_9EURO|nr:hypothetical protein PRK78_002213 [Emydomyces testavorans]
MAKNRTITNYFTASTSASSSARKDDPPSRSSSLSPCPSYLSQPFSSPLVTRATRTLNEHSTQSSVSDNVSLDYDAKRPDPSQRTSLGASFGSSQRVVKDGQVIVTGTDGEDNDSISGDDLLRQFLGTTSRSSPTRRKAASKIPTTPSKYKFSLDDLVMDAVDDREAEANISKLNLAFKSPRADSEAAKANRTPKQRSRMFRDDILASVIGEDTSIGKMQRLKDAVDRTEALDQGKSWSFFADTVASVAPPRFPEKQVTTDRMLGTSEPKDEVRFAYCSAIKVAPANRISSLVHSTQIEQMFRNLGARPDALSVEDVIIPDFRGLDRESSSLQLHNSRLSFLGSKSRDHKYLLSALDLIDGLASK